MHLKLFKHFQQKNKTSLCNISFSVTEGPINRIHDKLKLLRNNAKNELHFKIVAGKLIDSQS